MIKRAIIYLRVSTGRQVDGASLETQELLCQNWATNNNVVIDRIFHDDGKSAKTLNRPAMQDLLEYVKNNNGRISYLITYQTDRLTRNASDFFALITLLGKSGIEYKNVNSSVGENTANDELIQGIEAVLAQHDNRIKSDRVKENMKRHAQDGYRMSKAPFGLKNVRDVLGRSTVAPIPEMADNIASLLNAYSSGAYTVANLLAQAKEMGLKNTLNKDFTLQTISKLLRQPLYAGLEQSSHTDRLLVKSKFDGIITPATFHKNQEILKKNKNTSARYKQLNPLFPLRRWLKCAECGCPLRGSSPTDGSGKPSSRYHCTNCNAPSVCADKLHTDFANMLSNLKPTPEAIKLIRELILRVWHDEVRILASKEKRAHRALERLKGGKRAAIGKLVGGDITLEEKEAYTSGVDEEIEVLNRQLNDISAITKLKEEAIDYTLRFISNADHIWNNSSIDSQIIYQNLLFPNGLNYDLANKKFGTEKMGALYTLISIKDDPSESTSKLMVTPRRIELLLPG